MTACLLFFYIASKPTVFSLKHTQWLLNQETRFKENKHLPFILYQRFENLRLDIREVKQQLGLITTFSKDINMEFGIDTCSYINMEKRLGKITCCESMS